MNKTPIGDIDFSQYDYHPFSEELVQVLSTKTQSNNIDFFRILVAYYMAKIASTMRTNIETHDRGRIPVNVYALNLAPSGTGKGYATYILEDKIIKPFKDEFMSDTFQIVAEKSLRALAVKRASGDVDDEDAEYDKATAEFEACGPMLFSFDSGTTPAIKQMRQKLLMAGSGAMSMEIDEIASNLLGNVEVLTTYLELYDVGRIKEKLIKNTAENKRIRPIDGKTPANMMLFGTPNKMFEDPRLEEELLSMIDTGYGRRCIFGYSRAALHASELTAEDLYDALTDTSVNTQLQDLSNAITDLADVSFFNINLEMSKETHIALLEYKIDCNKRGKKYGEHQEKEKTELEHRYYKALKLAGAYAFIDQSEEVTLNHIQNAIRLTEDSGEAFLNIIAREKPYERLAKYIAEVGKEVTQVDLMENLGFYKGSSEHKRTMLSLAATYGYKNNIVITKSFIDEIEFYKGETLEPTDIDAITLAYSKDVTHDYTPVNVEFSELDQLLSAKDYQYTAHHFVGNYRNSTKVIPGFNMIILDVDEGTTLSTAQLLLKDYCYKMYTTKRHTDTKHRFRVLLPISHTLKLGGKEYARYMENVFEWLPFFVDTGTKDIARKWSSNEGATIVTNDGELLDATLFIPQTKKSDQVKSEIKEHTDLTNLERWFLLKTKEGNRSHMLLKYGLILKDAKYPIDAIRTKIDIFNAKLDSPLGDEEISRSIMITIAKRMGD
jgi:hypothetical protein